MILIYFLLNFYSQVIRTVLIAINRCEVSSEKAPARGFFYFETRFFSAISP